MKTKTKEYEAPGLELHQLEIDSASPLLQWTEG